MKVTLKADRSHEYLFCTLTSIRQRREEFLGCFQSFWSKYRITFFKILIMLKIITILKKKREKIGYDKQHLIAKFFLG